MKKFTIFFNTIKVPLDFIMTVLGFIAAYEIRLITPVIENFGFQAIDYTQFPNQEEFFKSSLTAALFLIITFSIKGNYKMKNEENFSKEFSKIISSWTTWIMLIITYFFLTRTLAFSRLAIFYTWFFTLILIIITRLILHIIQDILHKKGYGKTKVLIIGDNKITKEIYKAINKNNYYKISKNVKQIKDLKEFTQEIKELKIDELIQTDSKLSTEITQFVMEYCELNHINYRFTPDITEVRRRNLDIETLVGIPIINIKSTPLEGWGKVTKRSIDIFGATIGLIILSPLFLITAIAIKIDSKGPVFFTKLDDGSPSQRVGEKGQLFTCYKFRSMKPNTHNQRYKELSRQNTRKDSPLVKIKQDPRVTKVGKFIRKYSIDELPQLLNVLIGNMSLVGPRPHLQEEVEKYKKHHHFVLKIKPGLSGMAQISGRSNLNFEKEIKLDTYYIENWSVWLDIKILFKTIKVVLQGHNE